MPLMNLVNHPGRILVDYAMEITTRNSKNVPIDRLGFLPDEIICHILSFLPTKISLSTSILARRWRSLWVHVANLDFTFDQLTQMRYSDIISCVMRQRKPQTINTFRLSSVNVRICELKAWITNAISCNVRCFDLSLPYRLTIPQKLFTCETLVNLKLGSCVIGGDTVSLPNLKKLHLCSVALYADKTIPRLLSGCPVLEELLIVSVSGGSRNLSCWNISSPTINRLTLEIPSQHKVEVFAPALWCIQFYNCSYRNISLCHLSSLVEAHIQLKSDSMEEDYDNPIYLFDFLNKIPNVKYLKLSGVNIVEFKDMRIIGSSHPIPKFYNLTNLDTDGDWRFLTKLLECADNLQVLVIREPCWGATDKYLKIWMKTVERRPSFLCSLRSITFDEFGCKEVEFMMVKYLMRNAKVLKRMKICFYDDFYEDFVCEDKKSDAMKRISASEKGQEACEIVFC